MNQKTHEKIFLNNKCNTEEISKNPRIYGPDFNKNPTFDEIFDNYKNIGFQASNLALAVEQIQQMLRYKNEAQKNCRIFYGYSSNMTSCGLRDITRYLVQHKLVDVMVTTAGGVEEDFIKCMSSFYLGDFALPGRELREKEINRTGNLLVGNDCYCKFEQWVLPILDECLKLQQQGFHWTPSRLIWKLGEQINDESSIYYWAFRNKIPVFCPAITDGALGDCLYFHSFSNPGLIIDVVGDIRCMNQLAANSQKNGVVVVGGGVCKHHCLNACLFSESGADYAVYINTAQEFDGCDSGARPDEAISWGKISGDASPVKVYCDATIAAPIIFKQSFAKIYEENKEFYDTKVNEDPYTYWRELEDDIGKKVEWIKW